ncbi:MAG: hypothetical protein M3409_03790, partial [Gemmatimonadota bacterium]|nr:hypothetical protein [Gemmatimonadota bacterium]
RWYEQVSSSRTECRWSGRIKCSERKPPDHPRSTTFDNISHLLCLVYQDVGKRLGWYERGPIGAWAYRARHRGGGPEEDVGKEIEAQGEAWPLLRAGLFNADLSQLQQTKQETDEYVQRAIAGHR